MIQMLTATLLHSYSLNSMTKTWLTEVELAGVEQSGAGRGRGTATAQEQVGSVLGAQPAGHRKATKQRRIDLIDL